MHMLNMSFVLCTVASEAKCIISESDGLLAVFHINDSLGEATYHYKLLRSIVLSCFC